MRSRVYGWGDQRPRQTTWRESCIPLSNLLLCSSGVWLFVFSDSRKKGEKKVSISYSLVGIHNVKVVKVVPYFYPSLWLLSFFGPMPSPLICFSWEFPLDVKQTKQKQNGTLILFFYEEIKWTYGILRFFNRRINWRCIRFIRILLGGKNKYNRKFKFFNLTSSIFYPVNFFSYSYFFSFLELKSDLTSFMIYSVILCLKTTIKLLSPIKKTLNTYISARIFTLDLVDFVQNFRGIVNVLFSWFSQSSLSWLEKSRNCSKFRLVQGPTVHRTWWGVLLHVEVEDR